MTVDVMETSRDGHWFRGRRPDGQVGIFPASYIRVAEENVRAQRGTNSLDKIDETLFEWGSELRSHYREGRYRNFYSLKDRLVMLLNYRRRCVDPQVSEMDRQHNIRVTLDKIEEAKRQLGFEMTVRKADGSPADDTNTGINELLDMHVELAMADQILSGSAAGDETAKARMRRIKRRLGKGGGNAGPAAREVGKPAEVSPDKVLQQLLFDFKAFICKVGEETQLFFSIYDTRTKEVVTEPYVVHLSAQGMVSDSGAIGQQRALFSDFLATELGNMVLVCRAVRTGSLVLQSDDPKGKKKDDKKAKKEAGVKKEAPVRRPVGCGFFKLTDDVFSSKNEHTMPIYRLKGSDEGLWGSAIDLLVSGQMEKLEVVPGSTGVVFGINKYSLRLDDFYAEFPEYEAVANCPHMTLAEEIKPGDARNDMYFWLESVEAPELPSNMSMELTVTPRLDSGRLLANSMSVGRGDKEKTIVKSVVLMNSATPVYREYFRLSIKPEEFAKAHVHFNVSLKDAKGDGKAAKKSGIDKDAFGYGYLRLTHDDGSVIANGEHVAQMYKTPKDISDMVFYLKKENTSEAFARKGSKIVLRTSFCSALMTQNDTLLSLIRWNEHTDQLEALLKKVTFINPVEIIKFLKEIFDAMFAILDARANISMPVYDALVFIIGILVDEKTSTFTNFRSVLDNYIEQHFQGKMAHRTLMQCLCTYLEKLDSPSHARLIRDSMKALEYIFRFIVSSRILYNTVLVSVSEEDTNMFKQNLMNCLAAFNHLMSQTSPTLIVAQTIALKNFSSMLHDLSKIYDIADLANIACTFICSIPSDDSKKALNTEKLGLIHELVSGAFYINPESRAAIMPTVLNMLSMHMNRSVEELVLCVDILGVMLDLIQTHFSEADQPLATWELVPLLPQLMGAIASFPEENYDRLKLVTSVLSFFHLMQPYMFDQYIEYLDDRAGFIYATLELCDKLLDSGFPPNWFVLTMLQCQTIFKVSMVLTPHVLPEYGDSIWRYYFSILLKLITAAPMQLEALPPAKQEAIKQRYGVDLRLEAAKSLVQMWERLEKEKVPALMGMLIQPAVDMVCMPSAELTEMGLKLYLSLLNREYELTGSFAQVQDKTVENLDLLTNNNNSKSGGGGLLGSLETHFQGSQDSKLKETGMAFLNEVRKLMQLMGDLNSLPSGPSYDDERVLATMRLMEFLLESNKKESYVRYVHLLATQHLASNNQTEAALTLLLHADMLEWESQEKFEAFAVANLPAQFEWERKISLMRDAIEYFDKGKDWERAVSILRRLEDYYISVYDYQTVAEVLAQRAAFYNKIVTMERFPPEFFRVGYYGKGFPSSISGKEFIYRGYELERMADFVARIQAKFPQAELLKSTDTPGADVINAPGQKLLITPVQPSDKYAMKKEENPDLVKMKDRPAFVRRYFTHNNVNVFIYAKPVKKPGAAKGVNEFADLWMKKSFLVTKDTFPTYHRSSVIIETTSIDCSPLENAVEALENKSAELIQFVEKHSSESNINVQPFTMALNGVLDAAVNGGVKMYEEAFLTKAYMDAHPEDKDLVMRLSSALQEQLIVLARGVALHKKIVPPQMQGLHDHMEEAFLSLKTLVKGASSNVMLNNQSA